MPKRRARGEGTIYQRSDGLWVAQITLPDGKRKTKYGKTQKSVKDWLLERRRELLDGVFVDDYKLTVSEFVHRWFNDIAKPNLKPATIATHTSVIRNHIDPTIGSILLSQLSPTHL